MTRHRWAPWPLWQRIAVALALCALDGACRAMAWIDGETPQERT